MDDMNIAAKEAQRAYNRQYYAEHKDKRKEYNRRHWERKAAQNRTKADNFGQVIANDEPATV